MFQHLRISVLMLTLLTIVTGVVYPAAVTLIAQTAFPRQAGGSLIRSGETVVGSELIGQSFSRPEYIWGRLSATSPVAYNAAASSGSNYGPLNPALKDAAASRIEQLKKYPCPESSPPVDLVTSSGSGLDPHISLAAAEYQIQRVATIRKMTVDEVRTIVQHHTEIRQWGLFGEPRVNVLQANLELDQSHPVTTP
ncbi:potassium-transporting ATPase subunit KdpC [Planctomicrobium piriforme]|uniref:Potassium-transporting ATPase KdpC subunit n=1 Tax=Planctomicrobium piriforme TaxID=1576369 RepID=A0A1I3T0H1_9PLAN|nr:potassium-transporting ATPase subunit KdpC [Planctomicrobium piriforme]SFJ63639.1 K+-transporting ATPase ATPase C chain [Planctomicrobium piriforme]